MARRSMAAAERAMRKDIEGYRANKDLDRIANYVARGRCHKNQSGPALNEVWMAHTG
jgi:hypothetical protein